MGRLSRWWISFENDDDFRGRMEGGETTRGCVDREPTRGYTTSTSFACFFFVCFLLPQLAADSSGRSSGSDAGGTWWRSRNWSSTQFEGELTAGWMGTAHRPEAATISFERRLDEGKGTVVDEEDNNKLYVCSCSATPPPLTETNERQMKTKKEEKWKFSTSRMNEWMKGEQKNGLPKTNRPMFRGDERSRNIRHKSTSTMWIAGINTGQDDHDHVLSGENHVRGLCGWT